MKLLLCTLAAVVLVGAFTVHPADAACWWTHWGWRCGPGPYWWHAHYGRPWGWGWHPYWHHWGHWHRW